MEFEWDDAKAEANLRKHGVSFDEAATVFADTLSLTGYDPDHSSDEDRYITMGLSAGGRLLAHGSRSSHSNHQCPRGQSGRTKGL